MTHHPLHWHSHSYVRIVCSVVQLAGVTSTEIQCDTWHLSLPAPMKLKTLLLWHHGQGPDWSPDGCPDWILAQTVRAESLAQCCSGYWSSPPAQPRKHTRIYLQMWTHAHKHRCTHRTSVNDMQLNKLIHKESLKCQQLHLHAFNLSLPFICLVNWF